MCGTKNSIFPESALLAVGTRKRSESKHLKVRWQGICGTKNSIFPESALLAFGTRKRSDSKHLISAVAGNMRN